MRGWLTMCCVLAACGAPPAVDAGVDAGGSDAGIDGGTGPYLGQEWACDDPALWSAAPSAESRLDASEADGCSPTTLPIARVLVGVTPESRDRVVRGACFRVVAARPASVGVEVGTTWAAYEHGVGELFVRRPYDEVSVEGRAWTEDGHLLVAREPLPRSRTPELVAESVTELVDVLGSGAYATRRSVRPSRGTALSTAADVVAIAERRETLAWIERSGASLALVEHDPAAEREVGRHALADSTRAAILVARVDGFDVILDGTLWRLRDGALDSSSLDGPIDQAFAHQDTLFTRVGDELRRHDDDGTITARARVPGLRALFTRDYDNVWVETDEGLSVLDHDLAAVEGLRVIPAPALRASLGALVDFVPRVDVAWGAGGFARLSEHDPGAPGPRFTALPVVDVGSSLRDERVVALRGSGDAVRIERVVTEGYCD